MARIVKKVIKTAVRIPYLILIAMTYGLFLFPIVSLYYWASVDEATMKDARELWWANTRFMAYPDADPRCHEAWLDMRDVESRYK